MTLTLPRERLRNGWGETLNPKQALRERFHDTPWPANQVAKSHLRQGLRRTVLARKTSVQAEIPSTQKYRLQGGNGGPSLTMQKFGYSEISWGYAYAGLCRA